MATAMRVESAQNMDDQSRFDDRCASRQLSDRDTELLVASLGSPKKPNSALLQAAERFKKRYS